MYFYAVIVSANKKGAIPYPIRPLIYKIYVFHLFLALTAAIDKKMPKATPNNAANSTWN